MVNSVRIIRRPPCRSARAPDVGARSAEASDTEATSQPNCALVMLNSSTMKLESAPSEGTTIAETAIVRLSAIANDMGTPERPGLGAVPASAAMGVKVIRLGRS
jgi:hypothetical protein